jgi:hypothetical protein
MTSPLRVADRRDGLNIWKTLQVKRQWWTRVSDKEWGIFTTKKNTKTDSVRLTGIPDI